MGVKQLPEWMSIEVLEPCSLLDIDLERLKLDMEDAEDVFWSRNKLDHSGRRTNEPRTKPPSNKWDKFV
jgi:hypothetical protein